MRFLKCFITVLILLCVFFSCKKDSNSVDLTPNFYIVNSGTTNFGNTLILFPSTDTVTYNIIISSTYLLSKSTTITLAVADSYRDAYNIANGTNYQAMPSNAYNFQTTITAGTTNIYDTIPVKFNKQFLKSANFMLPVKIESVSNYNFDTAESVIYLHTENNKVSGLYNASGIKMMYTGDAADSMLTSTDSFFLTKSLIPKDNNISQLDYADLGVNGWQYTLGYSVDGGAFFAAPNAVITQSIQTNSFKVLAASFDSVTNNIYIKTSYKNLSGDERIIEESLTLQ